MRLTLRTLLAWLDDALPPTEVREIGQQVAETPRVRELVDKINRVTRQRRLIVPPEGGTEGTDPNLVAQYLDGELDPEAVADYERHCFGSDVNLAEVASVHQVLSLLKQKAKVPPEARERMYHLVRGREAVRPQPIRPVTPSVLAPEVHSWRLPEPPRRSLVERFGPLIAVAALILLLGWSAWMSMGPPDKPETGPLVVTATTVPPVPPLNAKESPAESAIRPDPDAIATEVPDLAETEATDVGAPGAATITPAPAAVPGAATAEALPPDSSGIVGPLDGILLRYDPASRAWSRLIAGASLRDGDRLVNLAPFFTPIQIGSRKVTMVGDGEILVLASKEGTSGRFGLIRGRVRIVGEDAKPPLEVAFGQATVRLEIPATATAGLERINVREPGASVPSPSMLRISAVDSEIGVAAGETEETVAAGASLLFQPPTTVAADPSTVALSWIGEMAPPAVEQERGKGLASYFKTDRSPLLCLVEAAEDEKPGIRREAITALGAIGPLDVVVSSMSRKDDPETRKAAISVVREVASRDEDSAKKLRELLEQVGGSEESADKIEKLLIGYSAKEAADEATGAQLVNMLKDTEDVSVRELAIEALQKLSRRADRLGYDPDKPTENGGLKAWQDLVQRHEVRIPQPPPSR